jgi:poly [ADP-ribose] polymerase
MPLDEKGAVTGFEAFIGKKQLVGITKEKQAAKEEYKQAIQQGHGAYLLEEGFTSSLLLSFA